MNQQSLDESNALLAAALRGTRPGELIPATPTELAREAGIENKLAIARAVRALLARGRIEQAGNGYRLLDPRPVSADEHATVKRPARTAEPARRGRPTYEEIGRAIVDRLVEVSAEAAELRASLERARREAEEAKRQVLEATRRAASDRRGMLDAEQRAEEVRERLEMTEANLRAVVAAARDRSATPLDDTDARAILDLLSRRDALG